MDLFGREKLQMIFILGGYLEKPSSMKHITKSRVTQIKHESFYFHVYIVDCAAAYF